MDESRVVEEASVVAAMADEATADELIWGAASRDPMRDWGVLRCAECNVLAVRELVEVTCPGCNCEHSAWNANAFLRARSDLFRCPCGGVTEMISWIISSRT